MLVRTAQIAAAILAGLSMLGATGGGPSQGDLDAARAAEAQASAALASVQAQIAANGSATTNASAQVTSLQAQYAAAAAALDALQVQVAAAADTSARADAALAEATEAEKVARAALARDTAIAAASGVRLSQDGALAYAAGSQLGGMTTMFSDSGPAAVLDTLSGLDQISRRQAQDATAAATDAALAGEDQRQATALTAVRVGAQQQASNALATEKRLATTAAAQAAEIQAQQNTWAATLASLQNVSAGLEQQQLDAQAAVVSTQQRVDSVKAALAAAAAAAAAARARPGPISPGLGPSPDAGAAQAIAAGLLPQFGFGSGQMSCLVSLWNGESGWRWNADNPSSGAYGIPQSLPASKMASAGPNWLTDPATQIRWGLGYIRSAYGSPCAALSAWQSRSPHWY